LFWRDIIIAIICFIKKKIEKKKKKKKLALTLTGARCRRGPWWAQIRRMREAPSHRQHHAT
jgi:hypothetical protein